MSSNPLADEVWRAMAALVLDNRDSWRRAVIEAGGTAVQQDPHPEAAEPAADDRQGGRRTRRPWMRPRRRWRSTTSRSADSWCARPIRRIGGARWSRSPKPVARPSGKIDAIDDPRAGCPGRARRRGPRGAAGDPRESHHRLSGNQQPGSLIGPLNDRRFCFGGQVHILVVGGDIVRFMRRRTAGRCPVLRRLRLARRRRRQPCRVQAGDGVVRRRGAFDGHRRRTGRRTAARDHGRPVQPLVGDRPAIRRHRRQVHRRRHHGGVRRADRARGPRVRAHAVRRSTSRRMCRGLAAEVERRDGITLQLRIGLNSGEVIAGEIGSGPMGYTAIGEQVGMAQRMESVAPPGGVMVSELDGAVWSNGSDAGRDRSWSTSRVPTDPVPAHRLLAWRPVDESVGRSRVSLGASGRWARSMACSAGRQRQRMCRRRGRPAGNRQEPHHS